MSLIKIPLVRPFIPSPEEWLPLYQKSRDAGQYSNFGPCEQLATKRLNEVGIAAKRGYWPLIMLGYGSTDPSLSNIVCLPSDVTEAEARYIAAKVNEL